MINMSTQLQKHLEPHNLLRWHIWGFLAVIIYRVENRFGYHLWASHFRWYCVDRANEAYPAGYYWFLRSDVWPDVVKQKGDCDEQ